MNNNAVKQSSGDKKKKEFDEENMNKTAVKQSSGDKKKKGFDEENMNKTAVKQSSGDKKSLIVNPESENTVPRASENTSVPRSIAQTATQSFIKRILEQIRENCKPVIHQKDF
jgi:hypothetical protein